MDHSRPPQLSRRDLLKLGGSLAVSSLLAACAADEKNLLPEIRTAPTNTAAAPRSQQSAGSLPAVDLPILALGRMTYGIQPGDIEAFLALGTTDEERLRAYVNSQLNPDTIDDTEFEERYNAAGFETLHKSHEQLYADHIAANPYDSNDDSYWDWYSKPAYELVDASVLRAVYSKKQLVELLADFWHNHFNIFFWQDDGVPLLVSYNRDVLRANLLGNFRQMLEAVAKHPSMLYYLNQNNSSDAGPNENFARELFELHTLGAENYLGGARPELGGNGCERSCGRVCGQ